jgi:uncharacterized protein YcsI (UPF0317 family)
MAQPRDIKKIPLTWTDNKSQAIFAGDFRNIGVTMVGTGSIGVLGSKDLNAPDFTDPSTISNSYVNIVLADETVASTYNTSLSVSNSTKLAEVNSNLITFICVTRSADTVDAFLTVTTNQ